MKVGHIVPILNVSNLAESFEWFEKLGWKKGWDGVIGPTSAACATGTSRYSSAKTAKAHAVGPCRVMREMTIRAECG
jgi:hypothetical protein